METTKKGLNNAEVMVNLDNLIEKLESEKDERINRVIAESKKYTYSSWYRNISLNRAKRTSVRIADVCDELSIFDWWSNFISLSQLKQMRSFLKTAERLGYNGYVCFKVGSVGCANGMWAHKEESTNGYSPDGACLYHSFVSNRNYWDCCNDDEIWMGANDLNEYGHRNRWQFTLKEVKEYIASCGKEKELSVQE